jgi:colanic acid/amylovoran biosynthesis glycosyltransferase
MKRTKIIYVLTKYPHLSETFIAREIDQLIDYGNEITICSLKWNWPWSKKIGLQVHRANVVSPNRNIFSFLAIMIWAVRTRPHKLIEILEDIFHTELFSLNTLKLFYIFLSTVNIAYRCRGQKYQHVRAHFLHSESVCAMWLSTLLDIPYSINVHTQNIYFSKSIIQKVVDNSSFCVAISKETFDMLSILGKDKERIFLIHNGISIGEFNNQSHGENLDKDRFTIVAVGRLIRKKGFDLLINACKILEDEGVNFVCSIIGAGSEYKNLSNLIGLLNLKQRVYLTGALPFNEVKEYMSRSSVVVVPSRPSLEDNDRDGLPTVIIESLALGIPVIATDFAGIPDIIAHDETGLLVMPDNYPELASAIILLYKDEKLRIKLGLQGRGKVIEDFSLEKSIRQLDRLIHSMNLQIEIPEIQPVSIAHG